MTNETTWWYETKYEKGQQAQQLLIGFKNVLLNLVCYRLFSEWKIVAKTYLLRLSDFGNMYFTLHEYCFLNLFFLNKSYHVHWIFEFC